MSNPRRFWRTEILPMPMDKHAALAAAIDLLGAGTVLSREDSAAYRKLLDCLVTEVAPPTMLELVGVVNLAGSVWEGRRYQRHKVLTVERTHRRLAAVSAGRKQTADARKQAFKADETPKTLGERVEQVEDNCTGLVPEVDAILKLQPEELAQARALQATIGYYGELDDLHQAAMLRQSTALDHMERCRKNFRQHKIGDELTMTERTPENEAPPMVPADDEAK